MTLVHQTLPDGVTRCRRCRHPFLARRRNHVFCCRPCAVLYHVRAYDARQRAAR